MALPSAAAQAARRLALAARELQRARRTGLRSEARPALDARRDCRPSPRRGDREAGADRREPLSRSDRGSAITLSDLSPAPFGWALLAICVYDFLRSGLSEGQGLLSWAAARAAFGLLRGVSRITGRRFIARLRGPVCLIVGAGLWLVGGWAAFALIFAAEGALVLDGGGAVDAAWIIGHAGVSLSTLGASPTTATSGSWASLGGAASLLGMMTVTMGVSYLLNITQTVRRMREAALRANVALAACPELPEDLLTRLGEELSAMTVALQAAPLAAFYGGRDPMQDLSRAILALCDRLDARPPRSPGEAAAVALIDSAFARLESRPGRRFHSAPRANARAWAQARG